jgi:site-specific DNA recombinase
MPKTTKNNTVVCYYRVSTVEQSQSGLGLEAQKAACHSYAQKNGLVIISEHTDAGVSGKAALEDRAGLVAAMADVVTNKPSALLVAKMDRVSREMLTQLIIEKSLTQNGCRLVSAANEGTEGDDAASVFTRRIMSGVSELEASLVSARTKAALRAKRERGERLGHPPATLRVEDGLLVPTPATASVVQAVEMRAAGATYREIQEATGFKQTKTFRVCRYWKGREDELRTIWGRRA